MVCEGVWCSSDGVCRAVMVYVGSDGVLGCVVCNSDGVCVAVRVLAYGGDWMHMW